MHTLPQSFLDVRGIGVLHHALDHIFRVTVAVVPAVTAHGIPLAPVRTAAPIGAANAGVPVAATGIAILTGIPIVAAVTAALEQGDLVDVLHGDRQAAALGYAHLHGNVNVEIVPLRAMI